MRKTSDYFMRQEFTDYLRNLPPKKRPKRPKQLPGYIGSILDNVLAPLGCGVLITDIGSAIKYTNSKDKVFEGLDVIYDFLKKLVWINNNFQSNSTIQLFLKKLKLNSRSLNAWPSVIPVYKDFLKNEIEQGIIMPKTSPRYAVTNWNNAIKKLKEIELEILSLKGTDSLLAQFNNNFSQILSIVLKDSYFLSSELAKNRFRDVAVAVQQNKCLFARESKKSNTQSNNAFHYISEINNSPKSINIEIDSDGNTEVKRLISEKTGYTVSAGYDSIFQHYIISHIWGDAFDPRNFTNYWNIVIVPAWANFLLDKQGSQDELAKCFINTFKAICIKHYKMRAMKWNLIDKDFKNLKPDKNYVVSPVSGYTINVINKKRKGQDYGKIVPKTIII